MELGELLGSGRSADVYTIGEDLVLRRYRSDLDARREAAVIGYVAAHGYPVPRVHPGDQPATDLVMERLTGPTMLHAMLGGELSPEAAGDGIARLLLRLHRIPARCSADPRDRVLHLDLHPDNVMLTPRGPMVIDWSNTEEGLPEEDCAISAMILAQVAADDEDGRAPAARAAVSALLAGLGAAMDYGDALERARDRRGANSTMTARELSLLDAATALVRELGR
ncbi:aminoglycoside phosphotransferase family protein [Nonomuraea longispora]|uniref:Aminoglycoside phosphotransferase family protein n=1 Tax=Nonomuraea longispora TaxID=1848320 RepID=A0A4R4N8C6_9ACTN|nr:phosphotransferase [Nonomuraea longispora]TDC05178.1 aminoglycoside phosphotransferase family protein [Nonomuraea longispora]